MDKLLGIFGNELLESILKTDDLYKKSKMIIDFLFSGIKDKSGNPYIEHLYTVGNSLSGEEAIVGFMHDTIEDTILDSEDLKLLGFPKEIINSILVVTKKEKELYDDFIDRIINSNNIIAIRVKKVDMENNMNEERLSKVDSETRKRLEEKYNKNYIKIINKLEELI